MPLSQKYILFALVTLSLSFLSCSLESDLNISKISSARFSEIGTTIKIQGTITVPSGYFASSIPFGYALQDSSGGIYVVDTIEIERGQFELGDKVIVTGVRSDAYGLATLMEVKASKAGKGQNIQPMSVKTGSINEETEGYLISTSGVITEFRNDAPYGYKVFIDDGSGAIDIYVNTSTEMVKDTSNWSLGMTLSVTGFSSQYETEYECDPRVPLDINVSRE